MPKNDDYFHWASKAFANAMFFIKFTHTVGDLTLEVFDSSQTLIGSSQSLRDSEDVFVADVTLGDDFYVRVFGVNEDAVPYVLDIASDGDRDHDGVLDSEDGRPDDPNGQGCCSIFILSMESYIALIHRFSVVIKDIYLCYSYPLFNNHNK